MQKISRLQINILAVTSGRFIFCFMSTEATSQKLKQTYWSLQHYILSFSLNAIIIVSEVTKLAVPCYTLKKVKIKPLL